MKVALVDSFPNRPRTAEREFIRRSEVALERLGWTGKRMVTSDEIDAFDPDIVLATHEFTPKLTRHPTVGLMWTPPAQFQADPYRMRAIRSYDGYFSGSRPMTRYIRDLLFSMDKQAPIIEPFAPTCFATAFPAEPLDFSGLFYIGANWDGQRHGNLMQLLEKRVPLRVFGPRDRWTSLASGYVGELPFDGNSVLPAIHRYGAALCLNRAEHSAMGLPSARLFEAVAAGAVAIVEPLPIIREYFGDTVFYVDTELNADDKAEAIGDIWRRIQDDPRRARDMARAAHAIFNDKLSLEGLYRRLPDMLAEMHRVGGYTAPVVTTDGVESSTVEYPTVEYIVRVGGRPVPFIRRCLQSLADQTWPNLAVLFVSYKPVPGLEALIEEFRPRFRSMRVIEAPPGLRSNTLWQGLKNIEAPFFANQDDDDAMHPNHVTATMEALRRKPGCLVAYSGAIRVEEEEGRYVFAENFGGELNDVVQERRELKFLEPYSRMELLTGYNYIQSNSWIASREILRHDVLDDPDFEVGEDVYLYMVFSRHSDFVPTWRPTIEWNWRTDNSMHVPEKWHAVHLRTQARLQFDAIELRALKHRGAPAAPSPGAGPAVDQHLEELLRSRWLQLGRKLGLSRPTVIELQRGASLPWWRRKLATRSSR